MIIERNGHDGTSASEGSRVIMRMNSGSSRSRVRRSCNVGSEMDVSSPLAVKGRSFQGHTCALNIVLDLI